MNRDPETERDLLYFEVPWEKVQHGAGPPTEVAPVPGGWLVRVADAIVFVPRCSPDVTAGVLAGKVMDELERRAEQDFAGAPKIDPRRFVDALQTLKMCLRNAKSAEARKEAQLWLGRAQQVMDVMHKEEGLDLQLIDPRHVLNYLALIEENPSIALDRIRNFFEGLSMAMAIKYTKPTTIMRVEVNEDVFADVHLHLRHDDCIPSMGDDRFRTRVQQLGQAILSDLFDNWKPDQRDAFVQQVEEKLERDDVEECIARR